MPNIIQKVKLARRMYLEKEEKEEIEKNAYQRQMDMEEKAKDDKEIVDLT